MKIDSPELNHKIKSKYPNSRIKLGWKTDINKEVITDNFIERGWEEVQDDSDNWNFFWASVNTVKNIFSGKNYTKLNDNQILNHFPNFYELTRKDHMAKNIKKYKKALIKENKPIDYLDFLPLTFIFPQDMSVFLEEFKHSTNSLWILKPSNRCQGQGITLVNKSSTIKRMNSNKSISESLNLNVNDTYVISKYIDKPLLVGQKKFDMRIYVLVTSFHPLKIYLFRQGFCRFCNEKFSVDVGDIDNIYIHLTNVAVQKKYEKYSASHGGKWNLNNLKLYLEMNFGFDKTKQCFENIKNVIINSLKSVQTVMYNEKHCFECYGYDILIDENLKPWLIEINSSPSLCTTTMSDYILKKRLISDVINAVVTDRWIEEKGKPGVSTCTNTTEGYFDVIYDESDLIKKKKSEMSNKYGKKK